ncbi:hypothetical protein GGR51DRAFT_554938 [Nemania sp. FL0031]|nr:hypothetical protein GGR51DRAFT_554938 [Nemania sp. FL0031]
MHLAQPPDSFGDDLDYHTSIVQMTSVSPPAYDTLDDVFGSGSDSPLHGPTASASWETPDMSMSLDTRRLQAQHNTVGYREGITAGKAGSIQAGFDQGFALGANIGIRAGQILGLFEGISAALAEAGPADESVRVSSLLSQATAELNPDAIFTSEFWASDGTWAYPVAASLGADEIIYSDVADQHPLIAKWARIINDEIERWQIDPALPILESSEAPPQDESTAVSEASVKPDVTSRDAIAW